MHNTNKHIHKLVVILLVTIMFSSFFTNVKSNARETGEIGNTVTYVGDINDDGIVNAKDVTTLRRYLAGGWNVNINTKNADVDGDGNVNTKDVTILIRYLAGGWDIQLAQKETQPSVAPYVNQILSNDTLGLLVNYKQEDAREMLKSINALRLADDPYDSYDYVWDYDLERAAMQRAGEIAIKFSATYRPDGKSSKQTYADYGFNISPRGVLYGENIFFADRENYSTAEKAFKSFASNSSAKNNMLGYYEAVGISHITFDKLDFWVLIFASDSKNTYETNVQPVCGDRYVSLKVPLGLINSIQADYVAGEKNVSVGKNVPLPYYAVSAKFTNSEADFISIRPATENDDDCFLKFESGDNEFVKVENGRIWGLKAGTGTIYATYLGLPVSVPFEVTE